jgi:hypothetical protein
MFVNLPRLLGSLLPGSSDITMLPMTGNAGQRSLLAEWIDAPVEGEK